MTIIEISTLTADSTESALVFGVSRQAKAYRTFRYITTLGRAL